VRWEALEELPARGDWLDNPDTLARLLAPAAHSADQDRRRLVRLHTTRSPYRSEESETASHQ
jgi:hypothetical protein